MRSSSRSSARVVLATSSLQRASRLATAVATAVAIVVVAVGVAERPAAAASVAGPIAGGEHGRPFTSATVDLAAAGYVEEEFFIAGDATGYAVAPGTSLTPDGRWDVVPAGQQPFKTRILVRRPASPARFNGTVLLEWLNVTGGWDIDAVWAQVYTEVLRSGYVWVGVSAQRAAVNGPPVLEGVSQPLSTWDPERYGSLSIPDDALSYDIFTQAALALGPRRPRGSPDPLRGLGVRRLLALGASQSAHRLTTYVNGIEPRARAFDGYLIVGRFGRGATLAPGVDPPAPLRFRTDLSAPVFVANTESEALASYPARQPDTDLLRYWEVAGAAHQSSYVDATIDAQIRRDLGFLLPPCDPPANSMPGHYVLNAALDHLDRWAESAARARGSLPRVGTARRGLLRARITAPPRFAPIDIAGTPAEIQRDDFGNALGGIRLPQLVLATAQYGPVGTPEALRCDLRGFTLPFDAATLAELYPNHQTYVRRFSSATASALRAGFLLLSDALQSKRDAAAAPVP